MQAMNYDCCRFFAGEGHTLEEFHHAMTRLVALDDSQYSWRNTLVALDEHGDVVGICVAYDGGRLHELRRRFIEEMKESFQQDFSDMADETSTGEYYLDSLAVAEDHRGQGIATRLLKAAVERAHSMGLRAGLLVDQGNPKAEALYRRVGFRRAEETSWGGHPMYHMVTVL